MPSSKLVASVRGAVRHLRPGSALLDALLDRQYAAVGLRSIAGADDATHLLAEALGVPQYRPSIVHLSYRQFARVACALAGIDLEDLIVKASQSNGASVERPQVVAKPEKIADPQAVQILMKLPGHEMTKEAAEAVASGWPVGLSLDDYAQMALDRHTKPSVSK